MNSEENQYCEHMVLEAMSAGIRSVVADIRAKLVYRYPELADELEETVFSPENSYKIDVDITCTKCNMTNHIVAPIQLTNIVRDTTVYMLPDGTTCSTIKCTGGNTE
jgi:hypothetical protein